LTVQRIRSGTHKISKQILKHFSKGWNRNLFQSLVFCIFAHPLNKSSIMATAKEKYTKWVACWGNATSITDRREAVYSKDVTFRYPITICFNGSKLRFHFSNLTGTEPITITKAYVAKRDEDFISVPITLDSNAAITIEPGKEVTSDEIPFEVTAGDKIAVSIYLGNYTQMNAGTLVTGPLSKGQYSYGDFATTKNLPADKTRNTHWFYFMNTIDVLTEKKNHAIVCYGDSITAQSWPDYLILRTREEGFNNVSIIRRAVCGTRILRQYDCTTYQAYGLKGQTRFPIESEAAGADTIIIQHGINDIIHPVGVENNPFRPWSDMPTSEDLINGVKQYYLKVAKEKGYKKIWVGTLLPIWGWRTYNEDRESVRQGFNDWIRTCEGYDGCIDFDLGTRDEKNPKAFGDGFDSGDHLHPSEEGYKQMAECVPEELLK